MNRYVSLVMSAFGLLVLVACDYVEYEPRSGTVTYLERQEADSGVECGYGYDWDGRYRYSCDNWYEPECYAVEFEDAAGHLYSDCTTESRWEALSVGDAYTED